MIFWYIFVKTQNVIYCRLFFGIVYYNVHLMNGKLREFPTHLFAKATAVQSLIFKWYYHIYQYLNNQLLIFDLIYYSSIAKMHMCQGSWFLKIDPGKYICRFMLSYKRRPDIWWRLSWLIQPIIVRLIAKMHLTIV